MQQEQEIISAGHALCPLDGRYHDVGQELSPFFSEFALVKYRVKIEVSWLAYIIKNEAINATATDAEIKEVYWIFKNFNDFDFVRVKEIEKITNHDVKAVEIFIAEKLQSLQLERLSSFVHIGCTSEDINNIAYTLMMKDAMNSIWIPKADDLITMLTSIAKHYSDLPMLAHTHGQPATPTTVGKEIAVFASRLSGELGEIRLQPYYAKWNGATGTYAAISVAYPEQKWINHSAKFVKSLGLEFNPITTQIESHDSIVEVCDKIRHFNNIIRDLDVDMWLYISMDYFHQIPVRGEVGSSTMPHKVNPIRFENSESNVYTANALLEMLSNKLPCSRMQRDLSDSSSQRNIGMAIGYSLQSISQTMGGLKKVVPNKAKLKEDLNTRWEVLAEPIQTMLRKYGVQDAYNRLKEMTRGKSISKEAIQEFVESLNMLSEEDKNTLLDLTPESYIGYAKMIAETYA